MAEKLRDAGFPDDVYLDILYTTSIQNALDRLAHALGVPSEEILL